MSHFGKYPPIPVKTHTLTATTKKLKVRWSAEMAKDVRSFHLSPNHRAGRPKNIDESNELFRLSFKFNELYPPGSIVHVNESKLLGYGGMADITKPELRPVRVTSEAVVLIDKSAVGFLCSESQDEGDFYFVDDLFEWEIGKLAP